MLSAKVMGWVGCMHGAEAEEIIYLGCAIVGATPFACDCCFTITIMQLIACYMFKYKLNV